MSTRKLFSLFSFVLLLSVLTVPVCSDSLLPCQCERSAQNGNLLPICKQENYILPIQEYFSDPRMVNFSSNLFPVHQTVESVDQREFSAYGEAKISRFIASRSHEFNETTAVVSVLALLDNGSYALISTTSEFDKVPDLDIEDTPELTVASTINDPNVTCYDLVLYTNKILASKGDQGFQHCFFFSKSRDSLFN